MKINKRKEPSQNKYTIREFITRHNCSCVHDIDEIREKSNNKNDKIIIENKLNSLNKINKSYYQEYYRKHSQDEPIYALQNLKKYHNGTPPKIKEINLEAFYTKNEK